MDPFLSHRLEDSIAYWGELWGLPKLAAATSLRVSTRFRRSLGSYRASRREITLAAWLVDEPTPLLDEVLCHEAAHAAVHLTYGTGKRPHGREWRDFMARAGVPARVRIPESELPPSRRSAGRPSADLPGAGFRSWFSVRVWS